MKITERLLLDNYNGIAKGGSLISVINGVTLWWSYRTGDQGDGYNTVCARPDAQEITLEYDRVGVIILDDDCNDHSSLHQINSDEAKLFGTEI